MIPSLRFSGLDLGGIKQFAPGAFVSGRARANSNLMGPSFKSKRIEDGFCSVPKLVAGSGLILLIIVFSSPEIRRPANGVALPWFVESVSARRGLFGTARFRGEERKPAVRRRLNFFFVVVAAWTARGETG